MWVAGHRHAPAALPPGKKPGTHCKEGWVGPRAGLDGCGISRPPLGFDPQAVQPLRVAIPTELSRPTNWVIRPTRYAIDYSKERVHSSLWVGMSFISSSLTHDDFGPPVSVPPAPLSISHMRGDRSHCKTGLYLFSNPCCPSQNSELLGGVFGTSWWVFSSRSQPQSLASFVVSGTGNSSTGKSLKNRNSF